jgi:hypothetical protein
MFGRYTRRRKHLPTTSQFRERFYAEVATEEVYVFAIAYNAFKTSFESFRQDKEVKNAMTMADKWRSEGVEEGIAIGEARGIVLGETKGETKGLDLAWEIIKLLKANTPVAEIAEKLKLTTSDVERFKVAL